MELLIVTSIQQKLEESNKLLQDKNKNYYIDVLDFLNLMFQENNTELTKLQFKKITINENVFLLYNEIIKKYKLSKPEFLSENFDISEINEPEDIRNIIIDIAYKMSNNLLERLNYRLKKKIYKSLNKTKFILEYVK